MTVNVDNSLAVNVFVFGGNMGFMSNRYVLKGLGGIPFFSFFFFNADCH